MLAVDRDVFNVVAYASWRLIDRLAFAFGTGRKKKDVTHLVGLDCISCCVVSSPCGS